MGGKLLTDEIMSAIRSLGGVPVENTPDRQLFDFNGGLPVGFEDYSLLRLGAYEKGYEILACFSSDVHPEREVRFLSRDSVCVDDRRKEVRYGPAVVVKFCNWVSNDNASKVLRVEFLRVGKKESPVAAAFFDSACSDTYLVCQTKAGQREIRFLCGDNHYPKQAKKAVRDALELAAKFVVAANPDAFPFAHSPHLRSMLLKTRTILAPDNTVSAPREKSTCLPGHENCLQ